MNYSVISIPSASSSENLQALAEVSHFGSTDMGIPGQGPWTYRILQEPTLTTELARMSNARSSGLFDSVSFQPCPPSISTNQDRLVSQEWDLPGGRWQFGGVFDGHLNDRTVVYAVQILPGLIRRALESYLNSGTLFLAERLSNILRECIVQVDDMLCQHLLDFFPRDLQRLSHMSDTQVNAILGDPVTGVESTTAALRCLGGTTVLVSLMDPPKKNVWVANLGDCLAVLGRKVHGRWTSSIVNTTHSIVLNGTEAQKIIAEHPGERHVIEENRVVGFLEPTRALGDMWLKIPSLYTDRVFANVQQDFISSERLRHYSRRVLSPPYVSKIPDVYHYELSGAPGFLILSTDGLAGSDVYVSVGMQQMADRWVSVVGHALERSRGQANTALCLLRDAIGGRDIHKASRNMTVEMEEKWMDDVTIVIQRFC